MVGRGGGDGGRGGHGGGRGEQFADGVGDGLGRGVNFPQAAIRADLEGVLEDGRLVGIGENEDGERGRGGAGAEAADDFYAVEHGQAEVEEDDIGAETGDEGEAGFAIRSGGDCKSIRLKTRLVNGADDFVVVDNCDLFHG